MSGQYDVFMVDPPWPMFRTRRDSRMFIHGKWQSQDLPYGLLTIADIQALLATEVFSHAAPRHVVFLWATEWTLMSSEQMMVGLGYTPHTRLVWDKGNGVSLGTVRRTHEYLGWWYTAPMLRICAGVRGKYPTVIREPSREHSRKPEAAYRLVEALYPDARKLDVFTREMRVGWDGYGDQRDHFTPLLAPLRDGDETRTTGVQLPLTAT